MGVTPKVNGNSMELKVETFTVPAISKVPLHPSGPSRILEYCTHKLTKSGLFSNRAIWHPVPSARVPRGCERQHLIALKSNVCATSWSTCQLGEVALIPFGRRSTSLVQYQGPRTTISIWCTDMKAKIHFHKLPYVQFCFYPPLL